MNRQEFKGIVHTGDGYRVYDNEEEGAILIGGVDLIDEINEYATGHVRVLLNGEEVANGHLIVTHGWGYSEYTPVDSDEFIVGKCDLIERLEALAGQEAHVVIEEVPGRKCGPYGCVGETSRPTLINYGTDGTPVISRACYQHATYRVSSGNLWGWCHWHFPLPPGFERSDLKNPEARGIMADWHEENGNSDEAAALRRSVGE